MSEEYIEKYKKCILDVLKFTHKFCEENNLRYFLACGSAIGCVRHKGYIPWDDDIDIYMPREDYNKLLALKDKLNKEDYEVRSIEDYPYHLAFARIYSKNTTLYAKNCPDITGCPIDIFPLDLTDMNQEQYNKVYKEFKWKRLCYQSKFFRIPITDAIKDAMHKEYGSLARVLLKILNIFNSKEKLLKDLLDFQDSLNKKDGTKYITITESKSVMFDKEWFDDYVLMPFEDIEVRMAIGYHEFLTMFYGDYMTPPPIEKRVPSYQHNKYYLNLKEGLTIEEVKERLKQGEHLVI